MASPILMPDLDTDSTADTKEYTGAVDPCDVLLAVMTKKGKQRRRRNLIRKGRVLPTQVQRHHRMSANHVHLLNMLPLI